MLPVLILVIGSNDVEELTVVYRIAEDAFAYKVVSPGYGCISIPSQERLLPGPHSIFAFCACSAPNFSIAASIDTTPLYATLPA